MRQRRESKAAMWPQKLPNQWKHHCFFFSWGILKRRFQNCCSRAPLSRLLHPARKTVEKVAHERGLLKISPLREAEVSSGCGCMPRSSQAEHQPHPQEDMHLCGSQSACQHPTWWHHFWGKLSVRPPLLSPPLSHSLYVCLCPQAIRCCEGHPFLKSVRWGSPDSFVDRGHTCIK